MPSRPLNLLIINGSLSGGGAEHVIATLARHSRDLGHAVTIAAVHPGGEILRELTEAGFPTVVTGARGGGSAEQLGRAIASRQIDIVHSHDLRSLIDAGTCRLWQRRLRHVHTFHFGNYPHLPWKHLAMEGAAARLPDRLVAVGNVQRSTLRQTLRLRDERLTTIWNGVDYVAAPDWSGVYRDAHVVRIGSVSTLGEQKGVPTLLEAARLLRDTGRRFSLVLVGEGPKREELEQMSARLGLSTEVEFTGWVPDAARRLLPTFDVFVQSSYWEAMSIVILEAMAARRAIVATTVGENPAVLADGRTALLVPPREPQALADALARAVDNASLRENLAAAARRDYERRFTGRVMAERYLELFERCRSGQTAALAEGTTTTQ